MMMPANFSAVSENEMTYVMGGSRANYLAPVMEAAQWQNFSKNLVTIIGNKYVTSFVNNTVDQVFSGVYGSKGHTVLGSFAGEITDIWDDNYKADKNADWTVKAGQGALGVLNCALNVVGNLAAIYNLGFGTAKNIVNENKFGFPVVEA